jgi:hypothetical protein
MQDNEKKQQQEAGRWTLEQKIPAQRRSVSQVGSQVRPVRSEPERDKRARERDRTRHGPRRRDSPVRCAAPHPSDPDRAEGSGRLGERREWWWWSSVVVSGVRVPPVMAGR